VLKITNFKQFHEPLMAAAIMSESDPNDKEANKVVEQLRRKIFRKLREQSYPVLTVFTDKFSSGWAARGQDRTFSSKTTVSPQGAERGTPKGTPHTTTMNMQDSGEVIDNVPPELRDSR
jgi:hypothetical protein